MVRHHKPVSDVLEALDPQTAEEQKREEEAEIWPHPSISAPSSPPPPPPPGWTELRELRHSSAAENTRAARDVRRRVHGAVRSESCCRCNLLTGGRRKLDLQQTCDVFQELQRS